MPAASVNFLLPFKDLGCVDILQRSAYIASGPAAVTLVAGLVALALGGPAERYLAEAIRGQFAPDLLNLISVVSLGLVGLSGIAPRWRGYRDVGLLIAAGTAGVTFDYLSFAIGVLLDLRSGRRPARPRLLEVPQDPAQARPSVESQAGVSRVQGHEAAPAPAGQAPPAQARTSGAVRAAHARHGLVRRLHDRCALQQPELSHLQRRRRFQPRGPAHRDRHVDHIRAPGAHLPAPAGRARLAAGATHGQRPGVSRRGLHRLGQDRRHGDPVHPARKAQPERLRGALQPDLPR